MAVRELNERLEEEKSKREQADSQVLQLQAALDESKKTIENNENSKLLPQYLKGERDSSLI